jgi:hypothetical protein
MHVDHFRITILVPLDENVPSETCNLHPHDGLVGLFKVNEFFHHVKVGGALFSRGYIFCGFCVKLLFRVKGNQILLNHSLNNGGALLSVNLVDPIADSSLDKPKLFYTKVYVVVHIIDGQYQLICLEPADL